MTTASTTHTAVSPPAPPSPHSGDGVSASWLMHVPVPLFAVVMGTTGLGLAWRKAHEVLHVPALVSDSILALATAIFVAVTLLYALKALRHFDEVRAEFQHPVRSNFFPAFSISLLLLAIAALPLGSGLALGLWGVGLSLHLLATVNLMGRWLTRNHPITAITPAWFIPVVGNILVPVAGARLGFHELSWFFFAIGLIFWVLLFTIVFYRVVFHPPMPAKLVPTLFILIAPPAVGAVSYMALTGGAVDTFTRILVYGALFLTLLNLSLARQYRKLPFAVSWWAFTFPMAAVTIACLGFCQAMDHSAMTAISWGLLILTTVIVTAVFLRTLKALFAGALFLPE